MAILEQLRENYLKVRERQHLRVWHRVVGFYVYLLIVWGFYRLLSPLPVWIEEAFIKGIVFGLPIFWMVFRREKRDFSSLGIGMTNFYKSVALGLGLGILFLIFGQISNFLRFGDLLTFTQIQPSSGELGSFLFLAFMTAWWEELVFAGFILQRLAETLKDEWRASLITAFLFSLLYVPAMISRGTQPSQVALQLVLLFSLGLGNSILMLRTRNLIAPIMSHALWGVTVYLMV